MLFHSENNRHTIITDMPLIKNKIKKPVSQARFETANLSICSIVLITIKLNNFDVKKKKKTHQEREKKITMEQKCANCGFSCDVV